jgi:zinc protease
MRFLSDRAAAWALLAAVACSPGDTMPGWNTGASAGAVEPFFDLQVHTFTWPNGLTLKVVPDKTAPVVAYQTWFGVGSADEVAPKAGLAHLFEHLMFKGTDQYADGEYMAKLEAMGAEGLNAFTWVDETVYVQAVPKQYLGDVARLESIRMHGLTVEEGPFKSELDVVMNERRLSVDNDPGGKLGEVLLATAYEAHPYGWPVIGWMEDLEKLTAEDARTFYKGWYAPDNATIVVVGDVTPEEAAAVVDQHYASLPPGGAKRAARAVEPEQAAQKRTELTLPMSSDRVLVGFKVPEYTHADIPALLVLDAALTAGQTGRLPRALRDGGWVSDVGAMVMPSKDPALYEFTLQGRPGIPAEVAERRFWAELERVRTDGISEGELRMGIAQWEASTLASMQDASGKASFLGWALVHTGSHLDGLARIESIKHVTREDVLRVARKYLAPEKSTVVVGRAATPAEAIPLPDEAFVAPADLAEIRSRPAADPSLLPDGEVVRKEVAGAKLLLVHDGTLPLVHFRMDLPTGSNADPDELPGLANLTAKMMLRGTGQRSRRAFEEAVEQLGATLSVTVDADGVLVSGSCLADTWPAYAALVAEALSDPAFDAAQLRQLAQEVDNELAAIPDDDYELAAVAVRKRMYGDGHPYGRDSRGTRESLKRITPDDLRSFHQKYVRAGGAVIGIAGGFDARVEDDAAAILGGIAGDPEPTAAFPAPAWPQERVIVLVDKPDRTQAQVVMGQLGYDVRDPDLPAFVLANDAFGVGFGGRLFKEIRIKNGWSYYAYSSPLVTRRQCSLVLTMAPGNDVAAAAVAKMLELTEQADREGFTAEEIEQVRAARLNGRPFLEATVRKKLDLVMRRETAGYDKAAAVGKMATVTVEEANAAFSRVVEPRRLVIGVVSTASAVKEPLEKAVGPVEVVDWRSLQ